MALDYRKCAEEIYACLGGKDNIISAAHCATRLRLVIADNSKVDTKKLESVDGVQGIFTNSGQLQIIIGTGTVNKVYDEFLNVTGLTAATKEDVKAAAAARQPVWRQMVKALGDVFVPILPAIVASGLMMGIVEALGNAIPGFRSSDWYQFLDMVANTSFSYLPVLVAISSAKVFGGNIYLGAVIGLLMVHSSLTNGWNAADGYKIWYLFGHGIQIGKYTLGQINALGYQGHVIPVVIAVYFMSWLEKKLHKAVPEMIDLFVTPLTTVVVTAFLTFMVIGPIFSTLENWVLAGAEWLVQNPIGAMVMGAVYPLTVVMGLHHMYNTIELGMLGSVGLNTWMPIASAANFAQFGACLAVGLKTRNTKRKAVAIPSSMSAALGITEPAIFGVNFRLQKPFYYAMVAGAIGAAFGAFTGLGATSNGVTGLPGYLIINHPLTYTVLLLISGLIAFVLTTLFWHEDPSDADMPAKGEKDSARETKAQQPTQPIITTENGSIVQPVKGKVVAAKEIPDPTFASGMMGTTVGVQPEDEIVYAPFDGTVTFVFDTKHAIGLTADNGMEALIHVGIDTVNMKGDGFTAYVENGQKVKTGDKLLKFDRKKIKEAGHPDVVCVVLTNAANYKDIHTVVE